ncbi:hypothetical protein B0J13DRAFT_525339 [Dactylonectria estremocensis]|uniref:Uncharacterized protein n=1 Tax=Dactylonectria estremocensis TaxID=1079267 RepID=A0A9P9J3M2_9HYPO|nr:hypothetical protein B0J13DRAFT_525339 [Dactylonectria estremocensis]
MFCSRLPLQRPALLALLVLCAGASADDQDAAVTTAPIYLPYYNRESWSLVRGSVIASDPHLQQTTYTIFCPDDDPPACDISLEFPFELVEGAGTVGFHGTYTSTYIANLECTLEGTTAATCSGYSSYKAGYTNGLHTGPTEVKWTSTFSGTEVEWGVLTMAEVPKETDDSWDITATAFSTPTTGSGYANIPLSTGDEAAGASRRGGMRKAILGASGSVIFAMLLF